MTTAAKTRVVYFGDSITAGQHVDERDRWTSVLARRFAVEYGPSVEALNRGASGETTRQALERFPGDVQELAPDVLTIQFGLNDCNCWMTDRGLPRVSERAFAANLAEMVERARQFGVRRVLLVTNHRTLRRDPMPSGVPYEEANARYSDLVRAVAAESSASLCDVQSAFAPLADEELAELLLPEPDQLHLSVAGHTFYGQIMWPFLRQAIDDVVHPELREAAAG